MNLNLNPNEPVSGRIGFHIRLIRKITYLAKLTSDIFQPIDRRHDSRNGIWNDAVCLVMLSECISIYSVVEDYETENKTSVDTEHE